MLTGRSDDGRLTVLVVGFVMIAGVLVVAGVDVSKVFLARRALSSVADAAAIAAAQSVDRAALYGGSGGGCGEDLPVDPAAAEAAVGFAVADDGADLRRLFTTVDAPGTTVAGGRVSVRLAGEVAVPFGRVLALLDPRHRDGRVRVTVTANAASRVSTPGGC